MDNDAINDAEENTPEENQEALEIEAVEGSESENSEAESESTQTPKFTQEQVTALMTRQSRKDKSKKSEAEQRAEQAARELELEREKNKIYELALEQAKGGQSEASGPPNPDDYADGEYDPEYKKKQDEFNESKLREEVARQVAEAEAKKEQQAQTEAQKQQLEQTQREHYKRSLELEVSDFPETEDEVINTLGQTNVDFIIGNYENSEALIYHLGKNKGKAEKIANLAKSNVHLAIRELERISLGLEVKPETSIAPNPVEPLEGAITHSTNPLLKGATFT